MKLDKFQSMAVKKEGKSILVVAPPVWKNKCYFK